MLKQNSQAFCLMPITRLREMIAYKAKKAGITVLEQEEGYTSKADFLSNDGIPAYGRDGAGAKFSGRRRGRGLYVSGTGAAVNADMNAAANILRKAFPDAFKDTKDFSFLAGPDVYGFKRLDKCIPVEGIAGPRGGSSATKANCKPTGAGSLFQCRKPRSIRQNWAAAIHAACHAARFRPYSRAKDTVKTLGQPIRGYNCVDRGG